MDIKGHVVLNLGIQSGTSKAGKPWSKASIVIETEGQYPKKVMLDHLKNAEEFNKIPVGSVGVFSVEIQSNEFNGRWYTSVNCFKWQLETQAQEQAPAAPQSTLEAMGVQGYQQAPQPTPEQDDLPF